MNGIERKKWKKQACSVDGNDDAGLVVCRSIWKKDGFIWKIKGRFNEGIETRKSRMNNASFTDICPGYSKKEQKIPNSVQNLALLSLSSVLIPNRQYPLE